MRLATKLIPLLLAGCASTAVEDNYYSLLLSGGDSARQLQGALGSDAILVGPVELAGFLDQASLVTQVGASQIRTANHHFSADPLDQAIASVIASELTARNADRVFRPDSGERTSSGQCRLRLSVENFHPTDQATIVVSGTYDIATGDAARTWSFAVERNLSARGYAGAVSDLREALREVAAQIDDNLPGGTDCAQTD